MPSIITNNRIAAAVAPAAAAVALAFAPAASADVNCTNYAAPSGSDSAAGTLEAPFQTAQRLVSSLDPGETGCLRGGVYAEDVSVRNGGTAGSPITLTSYPGERAKVVGRFWVTRDGDNVTVSNLDLNGTKARGTNQDNYPSPTVNGSNVTFTGNDVTNDHEAICFVLGSGWGVAENPVIDGNRIHDCGVLPANNHEHGIYVEESRGAKITNNVIYDNADRGIMFYPDAQDSVVRGNVIDSNGVGILFSGDGGQVSNDNLVEDNIITNSNVRENVESWYPDGNPIGSGNVVRNNCIGGGSRDGGDGAIGDQRGYRVERNNTITRNPKFRDRAGKDFRLQSGSPCEGIANGATGSTAARGAPQAPDSGNAGGGNDSSPGDDASTPAPAKARPVSLRTRRKRHGRIRMSGGVRRGTVRSAAAPPTRGVVQIRWAGAWYPLKSIRLRDGRYSLNLRFPRHLRGRVVKLRVVVPTVGSSRTVRLRAR